MALFIKLYVTALGLFAVLDALWIGVVASGFYKKHLGYLMGDSVNWYAVVAFYLVYAAGLVIVVVQPNLGKSLLVVGALGAVVGLMAYGAYDFTNQATIKDWPWAVTFLDLVWGALATGVVAALTAYIARSFYSL